MSINYKCPDCGKDISHNQNFCNNCGCKIDWSDENDEAKLNVKEYNEEYKSKVNYNENEEKVKNKEKNVFKLPLFLIVFQFFAYICGLLTKNFSFKISSGDELIQFIGYNFIIIIAILLLIKNRKHIKEIYIHKLNIVLTLISIILLCTTIYISIKNVNIIENDKQEFTSYEEKQEDSSSVVNNKNISKEQFFKYKEQYENDAIEIWVNGEIEDVLFEEIIITDNEAYRMMKLGNNDPIYDFYKVDFKKDGNKVTMTYGDVIFNGKIISNRLELYMKDGKTIYADYEKK